MPILHSRIILLLFALTIFSGASLLFWIQPLLAKMILPYLGGSPAVWNTCMMFFQGILLIGYIYAHLITRLSVKLQLFTHISLLLLGIIFLPFAVNPNWLIIDHSPILTLIRLLIVSAALPLIAISASSPLLQWWFSHTKHPQATDPYFLYSVSNAGSLIALLAFPFILEPTMTLTLQSYLWTFGFFIFIILITLCGSTNLIQSVQVKQASTIHLLNNVTLKRKLYWLALGFVPSSLLLGVTTYITTDIASVPLFWVIPLALYLLSFIFAFAQRQFLTKFAAQIIQFILIIPFFIIIAEPLYQMSIIWKLIIHLALFFVTAYVCNTELAQNRPSHESLTTYYLWISVGGFLGGAFNTLLAPLLFTDATEYVAVLMVAFLLVPFSLIRKEFILIGIIVFFSSQYYFTSEYFKNSIYTVRNFFGTIRVVELDPHVHYLLHGTTTHGLQLRDPGKEKNVISYYAPLVGIFKNFHKEDKPLNVAITGLGTGTCACLANDKDIFTFYEINPDVIKTSNNPAYFSFLKLCPPKGGIILGDARLNLIKAKDHSYDVMILDAFSSDSIPVHLLTSQAIEMYFEKLSDNGVILINISNRYLNLKKVLSALASKNQLEALYLNNDRDYENYIYSSTWVILAKKNVDLAKITAGENWQPLPASGKSYLWTDDYSNIVRTME